MIVFKDVEVLNEYVDVRIAMSMLGEDEVFENLHNNLLTLNRHEDLGALRLAIQHKKMAHYRANR